MADKSARSRPASRKADAKMNNTIKPSEHLRSREAEYQRLNQELEAKTAKLVSEAEEMLKLDFDEVPKSSLLDNVQAEDSLSSNDEDNSAQYREMHENLSQRSSKSGRSMMSSRHTPSLSSNRMSNASRPQSKHKAYLKPTRKGVAADDVALVPEVVADIREFTVQRTISSIEGQSDHGRMGSHIDLDMADIIPASANEMGSEAQIRFLKAKLRVMQEELMRVSQDSIQKEQDRLSMKSNMKQLEEENARQMKTTSMLKVQLDKHERLSSESRNKTIDLETELTQLRKEMNTISQNHQKTTSTKSITEVRLNRAIEELERYKKEVASYKSTLQDASSYGQKKMESLQVENKRLENQKKELIVAFKKQMKLIDLYKRQKVHVEAAKMLSFAEEEFLSALEWGK
ncbi:Testis-expressed protein 9 [Lamellibrachia satsuma]|nr:Testis-expressed protein 9 [Lamellibrachia satsuma]